MTLLKTGKNPLNIYSYYECENLKMKNINQHLCHDNEAYVCLADANLHLFPTVGKINNDQLLNEICSFIRYHFGLVEFLPDLSWFLVEKT